MNTRECASFGLHMYAGDSARVPDDSETHVETFAKADTAQNYGEEGRFRAEGFGHDVNHSAESYLTR